MDGSIKRQQSSLFIVVVAAGGSIDHLHFFLSLWQSTKEYYTLAAQTSSNYLRGVVVVVVGSWMNEWMKGPEWDSLARSMIMSLSFFRNDLKWPALIYLRFALVWQVPELGRSLARSSRLGYVTRPNENSIRRKLKDQQSCVVTLHDLSLSLSLFQVNWWSSNGPRPTLKCRK